MRNSYFHRTLFVAVVVTSSIARGTDADVRHAVLPKEHRGLLEKYCQDCHGPEKQKGKFRLDDLSFSVTDIETADRWQKVMGALNSGDMPPEDETPLPNDAKTDLLDDLANVMVAARKGLADQNGSITMRRLNRREYKNTLRELLGVETNVTDLPPDTGAGSFDTVGSNLFMSANQFEQYMDIGKEALEEAFAWQLAAKEELTWRYETEEISDKVAKFLEWQIDAQDRARNWAEAVEKAAAKPENAEIVAKIRAESKNDDIFRRSWAKIAGAPSPESFGFETKENNADKANSALRAYHMPYHKYYLSQPAIDTGMYLAIPTEHPAVLENGAVSFLVPWKWPVGNYIVRFRAALTGDGTPDRRFIEFGVNPRSSQALSSHEITGTMDSPQVVEIPFHFTRENFPRENRTLYLREKGTADHYLQTRRLANAGREANGVGRTFALWIDWVEIERVPDTSDSPPPGIAALKLPLYEEAPAPERDAVKRGLERFATTAFRGRKPSAKYVDGLMRAYDSRIEAGDRPVAALQQALSVVLSSPMFLYIAEPNADAKPRPLSPEELAARLSYFLWGAPPDGELLDVAQSGGLEKAEALHAQVERLLDDPRSKDLVHSFTYQWLGLDRLDFFEVDLAKHPRFDNSTKAAAREEIYETLGYLFHENGSIRNLLKSDYAVLNATMAEYYEIRGVRGDEFRKVTLPQNSPRGGLLGMAAVCLMGGNGDETNPVERGAWVLRKLLNDPPPPAPANVPQIARLAGQVLTTQERLSMHQEEAQCASCHRKMDPIGLGLENFDAVGAWRTENTFVVKDEEGAPVAGKEKTWTIDPAGALHKGPKFGSYYELRDILASREDDFAQGVSTALAEYALGRPIGFSDEEFIKSVVAQAKEKDFAIREFVHAIVSSQQFHTK